MAINFNGTYSQNFDALASTGLTPLPWSNDDTLAGWSLFAATGNAIATYSVGSGTSTTGAFYSYGASGSTERALGGLGSGGTYFGSPASGALAGWIAFSAVNVTGATITSLTVGFDGEQWRNGGNATLQSMAFEYGFGSSFDAVVNWTAPAGAFDWTSPVASATAAAVDGNAAGLVADRGGALSGVNWAAGDTLWMRWVERNDVGGDHGLAIDDFSITTDGGGGGATTPTVTLSVSASAGSESGQTVITVTATSSAPVNGPQGVALGVSGSGITAGDYVLGSTTIAIADGQTRGTASFTIVDDARKEGAEIAVLAISNPTSGLVLGDVVAQTVFIADNATSFLNRVGGASSATASEVPAFDAASGRLYVVAASTVNVYQLADDGALTPLQSISPGFDVPAGTVAAPNSVAIKNGLVAIAYEIKDAVTGAHHEGKVAFLDAATGADLGAIGVGALPDMLIFTPDGMTLLVANEGEPNGYGQPTSVDPLGSVSIIDLSAGVSAATVRTAGFEGFDAQKAELQAAGVRIFGPGASVAQDLEPEYITVTPDGRTAVVTLQEANAIAMVDIASATVTSIVPLGAKDFSLPGQGFDASDRDVNGTSAGGGKVNIQNWPVFGLYQPDAIASYTVGGQTYHVMANEGDSRSYTGYSEEVRVGDASYVLDPTAFPDAATLKLPANLGRLQLTRATGDTDGDGDIDRIESFGARSFSIRDSEGRLVFDSGDQFERITAAQSPTLFNSEGSVAGFDTRSDNKGPEPEGVVLGVIDGHTYAFIGLERIGDVIVYDVTRPDRPEFIDYVNLSEDRGVEGLAFVSAEDSPTGKPLLITAAEVSNTVSVYEINVPVRIHDIQGAAHLSPMLGQGVQDVAGIVTAIASNGFYLQDPYADDEHATSEGIFVFTGSATALLAARSVGEAVKVSGTVAEFRPGGSANNLTVTEIVNNAAVQPLSVIAWTGGQGLSIAPVVIGADRTPPSQTIHDDGAGNVETGGDFDPAAEGIDFYESLEGMWVQVNDALATSPTAHFGASEEIWVLADGAADATGTTARGGSLISANDFNPERIQIDDMIGSVALPDVDVGARLGSLQGVIGYDFNNYELLLPTAPLPIAPSSLARETTHVTEDGDHLSLATFNVENLDPADGAAKFAALAAAIVGNLRAPDILTLEEVQDASGPVNDGVVDASATLQALVDAIVAAGGPAYQFRQLDPVDGQDGGEPGGNIRVSFLFDPTRVEFVEGSLQRLTDLDLADGDAFAASRKPLVGTFLFNGEAVTVVANHFNSKGGDQPLFGPQQPPVLGSEVQRVQQAEVVGEFVEGLLASDAHARVVVAGDLNDFEFSMPLAVLESSGLTTLIETLPVAERYTYNFQGNAQALDHILVSDRLATALADIDVVHINSEFAQQVSDHDPIMASFLIERAGLSIVGSASRDQLVGTAGTDTISGGSGSDRIDGGAGRDAIDGGVGADWITGGAGRDTLTGGAGADRFVYADIGDGLDVITDFGVGGDRLEVGRLLDSIGYTGGNAVMDGVLGVMAIEGGSRVMIDPDGASGSAAAMALVDLAGVELIGAMPEELGRIFDLHGA